MPFKVLFDTWGGGPVSPCPLPNTPATGAELAPVVKTLPRKSTFAIGITPLPGGIGFASVWYDTQPTGDIYVTLSFTCQGSVNGVLQIFESDDTSNALQTVLINSVTYSLGVINHVSGQVRKRYWRAQINTGTLTSASLTATVANFGTTAILAQGVLNTVANQIPVSITSGAVVTDAATVLGVFQNNAVSQPLAVATWAQTGAPSGPNAVAIRTPNVYRGSQFSGAGQNVIWMPQFGKKVRLMKYKIEIGEDATITTGPLPINLAFSEGISSANGGVMGFNNLFAYSHRMVIPNAVLATAFDGYDSGWIDLGNGSLLASASQPLTMGIMVPQTTAAINPTWTIQSNQWEAGTVGFKTNGSLGNFKLVNVANVQSGAGGASVACGAISTATGNSIFVFIRTTKVVGGASTITVTDTALNSYTVTAQIANATDGANGTALCVAYATNVTGNAANIITVNFGTNNSAGAIVAAFEYAGMGTGGIDAVQVGATGNSTAPASGNYTPATAGDLIFSFFGSTANINVAPTIGSNFRLLTNFFTTSNIGSLGVADNFGNGALALGQINVICCGTEE